jgi:Protein of unknown function (DUF3108)
MKQTQFQTPNLKNQSPFLTFSTRFAVAIFLGAAAFFILKSVSAQTTEKSPTSFKIGEKLTYNVSFGRFKNAGYAEIAVVSRGKLSDKDAVELHSKFKTNELVAAAFYLLDDSRVTFASAETGLPIYIRKTSNAGILPKEAVNNYLSAPTQNFDLLTLIYRIRNAGGIGSFLLQEDEKIYTVNAQTGLSRKIKTDAGEFDTTVSTIQSEFFTEKGLTDFRVNFSSDEQKIPVLIRFKTSKGEFRASLASIQNAAPEPETTPTPAPTPTPIQTPTPIPTPTPSLDNQPLSTNLPFVLGESLEYKITANNQNVGSFLLQAKERKIVDRRDTLFLSATISNVEKGIGIFNVGDAIIAQVNAETLAPQQFEVKFSGTLSSFNQSARFDQERGIATFGGTNQTQIPINTHSLLSLVYAIRSFNLKPSKDSKNPINDTRVAVFYGTQFYVFTLRPLESELINLRGEKVTAQLITVVTGNPQLDALFLRVWMSNDEKRTPLRFAIGGYQADLVSETVVQPK